MGNSYKTQHGQYHGPLPVRDFFPLPNVIFDLGLTAEEIAIYAFLMRCEDRRSYTCYPSFKTIGKAIGKSKNTVMKYVRMLEDKGLIYSHPTFVVTKSVARNGNLMFIMRLSEMLWMYIIIISFGIRTMFRISRSENERSIDKYEWRITEISYPE